MRLEKDINPIELNRYLHYYMTGRIRYLARRVFNLRCDIWRLTNDLAWANSEIERLRELVKSADKP